MSVTAILQARMGASRLPGKVLRPLGESTVLGCVIERVRASGRVHKLVVATTDAPQDAAVADEAVRRGCDVFVGSETDVLARYEGAAKRFGGETLVRVTSDCPLFDPALLEQMITRYEELAASGRGVDYLSNTIVRTYPRGLDAEIFAAAALDRAHREASLPYEREHVTPYLYQHPDRFRLEAFVGERDLSSHRWTLDTQDDWQLIEAVYAALHRPGRLFTTAEILALLDRRPDLVRLNAHVAQKELGK